MGYFSEKSDRAKLTLVKTVFAVLKSASQSYPLASVFVKIGAVIRLAKLPHQLPVAGWCDVTGEATIADTMLDRSINPIHRRELTGENRWEKQ